MKPSDDLITSFKEVADMTAPKCASCRAPFACCSKEQCEDTKNFAETYFDVVLEETGGKLPFLGDKGCVVPPHFRPLCSVHVCEMHFSDPDWTDKYMAAREKAEEALYDVLVPERTDD